jgi:hypothetical protein
MSELLQQMIALLAPEKRITAALYDDLRAKLNHFGGLMRQGGEKAPDLKMGALSYGLSAPKAASGTQPTDANNDASGSRPTIH